MAISNAVNLANLSSGDTLTVDSVNDRVGIASTVPTTTLDVDGTVKATSFVGSGANLTNVISGVELQQSGSSVGTSITAINFTGATVSAPLAGLSTVSIAQQVTVGMRTGSPVVFTLTGSSFNVINRGGSNVPINI